MTRELQFLTELISTTLYNETLPEVPKGFSWDLFANLVLQNGFITLVHEHLNNIPKVPSKILSVLNEQYKEEFQRALLQDVYGEKILERFEQEGIKCMPLKGIILKHLYPQFYMRRMSDLDILIDIRNLKETRQIMTDLGFEAWRFDEHHDVYTYFSYVNVELHKLLLVGKLEEYFKIGFERAKLKRGSSYIYEMSIEDFYIHMIGHMASHFVHSGMGIRVVLDVRVYLDRYETVMNQVYLEKELKEAGLYTFTKHIEKLSAILFKDEPSNGFYDDLTEYIMKSGYLGNDKHRDILEVVKKNDSEKRWGARKRAIIDAIFLPYKSMCFTYPILKKVPALLPCAWVVRWITVLTKRRNNIGRLQKISQASSVEVEKLSELYEKMGMKHLL